jgi:Family of unknown function (DUF5947)
MSNTGLRRFAAGAAAPPTPAPATPAPATTAGAAAPAPAATTVEGSGPTAPAEEACEFCAVGIPAHHDHVANLDGPTLMCSCRACYLLFTRPGAGQAAGAGQAPQAGQASGTAPAARPGPGRYRSVPDRYRSDAARPLSAADWDALEIPVGLAFFLRRSDSQDTTRAFYPSPAGVTESQLNLEAWARVAAQHPLLEAAEPDVEAILISRGPADLGGQAGAEAFLVPIDVCYELAGRMRLLWHGFDGGAEARDSIADFLARVRERSRDISPEL